MQWKWQVGSCWRLEVGLPGCGVDGSVVEGLLLPNTSHAPRRPCGCRSGAMSGQLGSQSSNLVMNFGSRPAGRLDEFGLGTCTVTNVHFASGLLPPVPKHLNVLPRCGSCFPALVESGGLGGKGPQPFDRSAGQNVTNASPPSEM
jgi:hypothetical protein